MYEVMNVFPSDKLFVRKENLHSIYLETNIAASDREKTLIEFRNIISKLESEGSPETVIKALKELEVNAQFWQNSSRSIGIFADGESLLVYKMNASTPTMHYVGENYYVLPLIHYYQSKENFLILALAKDQYNLYWGHESSVDQLELHEFEDIDPVIASLSGAKNTNIETEGVKTFFREVDDKVRRISRDYGVDVLVVALPENYSLFKEVSRTNNLVDKPILKSMTSIDNESIKDEIGKIMKSYRNDFVEKTLDNYHSLVGKTEASDVLDEIVKAIMDHRVSTLLIDRSAQLEGSIDEDFNITHTSGRRDLLNLVGLKCLERDINVVVLETQEMPSDKGIAAIYSY